MQPFSIECTTCKARLRVRDPSAIGQILTCPKCSSMVLVEAPHSPAPAEEAAAAAPPDDMAAEAAHTPPAQEAPPPTPAATPPDRTSGPSATSGAGADMSDTVEDLSVYGTRPAPPPDDAGTALDQMSDHGPLLPTDQWSSTTSQLWRSWVLMGGAAAAGIVLAGTVFGFVIARFSRPDETAQESAPPPAAAAPEQARPAPAAAGGDTSESTGEENPPADANPPGGPRDEKGAPADPARPVAGDPDAPQQPPADPADAAPDAAVPDAAPPDDADDGPPGFTPKADPAGDGDAATTLDETVAQFEALLDDKPMPPVEPEEGADAPPADLPVEDAGPRRPPPRVVDVAARLDDNLIEIEIDGTPLVTFLQFMSQLSTIPITLDPEVLPWLNLTPVSPVTAQRSGATVEEILAEALTPLGLSCVVREKQLLVTRPSGPPRPLTLRIQDLASDRAELRAMATLMTTLVAPGSWRDGGGLGRITVQEDALVVQQSDPVKFEILRFFERLRVARGLPPRSSFAASLFALTPRHERAKLSLDAPVSLNYLQPTSLEEVVQRLGHAAGCHVLIDWGALAEAGWNPDAQVTLTVAERPLRDALRELLEPMELTYRAIDAELLQVTTPQQIARRPELEFYDVAELLGETTTPEQLITALKKALGEDLFVETGGQGVLYFDPPSKCLLAALAQPQQIALQQELDRLRGEAAAGPSAEPSP